MRNSAHCCTFVCSLCLACSAPSKHQPSKVSVPAAESQSQRAELEPGAWFQPNGSVVAVDTNGQTSPELSAPIAPCVTALNKDGYYPPVRQEQERMADAASLTFPYFLEACAKRYPIVRASAGETLTPDEARQNYENVARCSYETHYGKPYWVPQLIADVDLCGRALGPGWQLPTSESLALFNDQHRQLLYEALEGVPFGGGYNSILLYARGAGNKLTLIDLAPPAARKAGSTPSVPSETKTWFQASGVSLRCVREARTLPAVDMPPVRGEASGCGAVLSAMFGPKAVEAAARTPEKAATDPAILRLSAHAQALEQSPDSFDAKLTLRELERAAPAAKKTLASEGGNEQERQAELAKLAERFQQLRQTLEDPKTPASERAALQPEFQRVYAALTAQAQQGLGPRLTPDQRVLEEALRSISALIHARFRGLYPEYKHWVVIGKPIPGKTRTLASIEEEAAALRKVAQKIDEIKGTNSAERLQLPPKSRFKKK